MWRPLRQYVYERDGGKCRYCGKIVELYRAHVHHILDLQFSGTNHPSNLKVACVPCHKEKHPFMKDAKEMFMDDAAGGRPMILVDDTRIPKETV